jgi:glycosyltransferase involved in cell wall biosynthesis
MKVSIIVANYNYESYLTLAIQSILKQSYDDFEIIIVDDESTDSSRDIIQQLHSQYPNKINYIFQKNTGHGGVISTAFSAAKGEIISFLDSDDLWEESKLSQIVKVFEEDSTVMGVIHKLQIIDEFGESKNAVENIPEIPNGNLEKILVETGAAWFYPPTSAITVRRKVLETLHPVTSPEWKTSPDGCLLYGAAFLGKVMPIPEILGSYRVHGKNTYWRDGKPGREKQNKSLHGVQVTNIWINQFLEKIDSAQRVNLLDNLNYRRNQYYYQEQFSWVEFQEISIQILRWRFYDSRKKIEFLLRFWFKNLKFILNSKSSLGNSI